MSFRLEVLSRTRFDAHLAQLAGSRLTRTAAATYLQSDVALEEATYQLALAGIRATRCSDVPAPTGGFRPAVALDLAPLVGVLEVVDVVEVRPISLSDATAALMRRRPVWFGSARRAHATCRRLLHEEDAVLGWRRIVWCSVASLRIARASVRLRPVVFDRAAVASEHVRWTYVSENAIERWAFS